VGIAGFLVGAAVAGLVKRHNLLKDNAFFEGMVMGWPMYGSLSLFIALFLDGLCGSGSVWFDGIDRNAAGSNAIYREECIILMHFN
jgi:hypothetical protein